MDSVPSPVDEPLPAGGGGDRSGSGPEGPRARGGLAERLRARATVAFVASVALLFFLEARETPNLRLPFSDQVYAKYGGYHDCFVLSAKRAPPVASCALCSWERRQDASWERPHGQWWRLLSTLFVPRWGLDAFVYLFLFLSLGPPLERALGTARFCVLYLGAGMGGVAVGALVAPTAPTPGTVLVIYALLGGLPGVVLGRTGSLRRTIASPEARSAALWLAFWLGLGVLQSWGYFAAGWQLAAEVAAAVFAMAFGWALGRPLGVVGSAARAFVPALAVASCAGLVVTGHRWFEGGIVSRSELRPGGRGSAVANPSSGDRDGGVERIRGERAAREAHPLREKWEPFLNRFGPLPAVDPADVRAEDLARLRTAYRELSEATRSHRTGIVGELDDLRVRCLILMGREDAPEVADEYLALNPSPRARALAGVAYHYRAGQRLGPDADRAEDYLEGALAGAPELAVELPEALYFYALQLALRGDARNAEEQFRRYLALVEKGSALPTFRARLVRQARAQLRDD